jgi:glucose-1-phosphate adenylyltransferase
MMTQYQTDHGRYVSRLTRSTLALILAGGQGSRLYELTRWRAKPAVYFGGKLRIIDFPLSNCINSGVRRIGVLTQYKAHSLIRHLVRGWTGFQAAQREFIEILPASQRIGGEWYQGTADAVYQNLDIIRTHDPAQVLILAGDHVYKMDYGPLLAWHAEKQADMTVCCMPVPLAEAAGQLGVMSVDETGRITGFEEKPDKPTPIPGDPDRCMASMGNYVFNTDFLYEQVIKDADQEGSHRDFGKDIIPSVIDRCRVYAFPFQGTLADEGAYWRDVGTLDAFWEANQELVSIAPQLDLYDRDWPIYTAQVQLPGAKFVFDEPGRRGEAVNSIVSAGCIVSGGSVRQSLLFSNCRVHSRALVEGSVILPSCDIGQGARVRNVIMDRGVKIPQGMEIGFDAEADRGRGFRVTPGGRTLVTPDMMGQSLHFTR